MSYELVWQVPAKVICLTITGTYSIDEAKEANRFIIEMLDESDVFLYLLIDASKMNRPYNFTQIRAVQTFMNHRKLKHIYVATNDRVVKLSMMVMFNLGRAGLNVYDDVDLANAVLKKQLDSQE